VAVPTGKWAAHTSRNTLSILFIAVAIPAHGKDKCSTVTRGTCDVLILRKVNLLGPFPVVGHGAIGLFLNEEHEAREFFRARGSKLPSGTTRDEQAP
jgi:hypothetical protein